MKTTCGIFLLNKYNELLITHPTFRPEYHCWSVPKGEPNDIGEDYLSAAIREFHEETGLRLSTEKIISMSTSIYRSNKKIMYSFFIKDENIGREKIICESTYTLKGVKYPENDRYYWLSIINKKDFFIYSLLKAIY
jgi:ADP-ribose pyrophosphatase YjhB (NUDIX family)